MKKILIALTFLFSSVSNASLIEIVLDKTNFDINENITGELRLSGATETLGGFYALLNYLPSGLQFVDWQFGNGFDDGSGPWQEAINNPGELSLNDFSYLYFDESILAANQAGGFSLGTFSFSALTAGQHQLSLNGLAVVNFDNSSLEDIAGSSVFFNVSNGTPVPTPASILLLITGLVMLRRKL